MNRFFAKLLLCISFLFIIAGCGNSGGTNKVPQNSKVVSQNEIDAVWQSACYQSKEGVIEYSLRFSKGNFVETTNYFSDTRCSEKIAAWENSGSFVLSPSSGSLPASKNIDMVLTDAAYTVFDIRSLNKANGLKTCGISDWIIGEKRACSQIKKTLYQVYMLAGDMLTLGSLGITNDGSTPEKRPESFSNQILNKK